MDQVNVKELLNTKKENNPYSVLTFIRHTDTIEAAINKMAGAKVQSLPVLFDNYCCMIDFGQITEALLKHLNGVDAFLKESVSTITRPTESSPLDLDDSPSLLDLTKSLSARGKYRILITESGKPVSILSQMDVIRYFCKHLHLLSEKARHTPINQLIHLGVVSVSESDSVVTGLKVILENKLYGVAVVNDAGKMVGNFSLSDLRYSSSSDLQAFIKLTIKQFLTRTQQYCKDPVSLKMIDTFERALHELVRNHVHRLYLVNDSNVPVAVFSTSDAIARLLELSPQQS